jgi:NuA3 HAT complex component NTO1
LRTKVEEREYHSVVYLAQDIANVIRDKVGVVPTGEVKTKQTPEQKHIKSRATIILSKVKPILMDAARKEAELGLKSDAIVEEDIQRIQLILQNALKAGPGSTIPSVGGVEERDGETVSLVGSANGLVNGHSEADADGDVDMMDASKRESDAPNNIGGPTAHEEIMQNDIKLDFDASEAIHALHADEVDGSVPALSNSGSTNPSHGHVDPPTPPRSDKDLLAPLAHGGIMWYLDAFDPQGTTIHDEEWSGREVLRDLSEELSELDEDALNGLVDADVQDESSNGMVLNQDSLHPPVAAAKRKAPSRKKRVR